jgi:rubrerythrin
MTSPMDKIVLPESMHRGAIERAHHAVAHKAVEATVAELHKTVYFSGMYRWVNETLWRCETCQVKKGSIPNQRGLLVSHVTGYPFQKISIDFVGPCPGRQRATSTCSLSLTASPGG